MVIGAQNTSGNVQSRRDNNGFPNGSAGNGNNGNGGGNASSPESGPNLYGAHSFQNGAAAHAFINAALGAGNHVGTVAAATSITNQQLFQQQGPRGAYGTSLSGSYPFNATGITRGRQNSSFGNVMGLHQMPTAPGMRFPRQTPCPASAMILVAEVQDPPRSPGPAYLMNGHHGSPGFPLVSSQSSQSSTSSCGCDECRNCVCHLYCHEHAEQNCPVHGRGALGGTVRRSSGSDGEHPISSPDSLYEL